MMLVKKIALLGEENVTKEIAAKFRRNPEILEITATTLADQNLDLSQYDWVVDTFEGERAELLDHLNRIEAAVSSDAIISAFSTSVSSTEIRQILNRGERFVGLHFFRLALQTDLVEIVKPEGRGSAQLFEVIARVLEKAGFVPVMA